MNMKYRNEVLAVKKLLAIVMVLAMVLGCMPVAFAASAKYGDVDGDTEVSIMDATEIQLHIVKLVTIDEAKIKYADVDADGDITVMDATDIQMFMVGLIESFPAESKPDVVYTLETFVHDIEVAAGVSLPYKREFTDQRYGLFIEYHSGKNRVAVCWDEERNAPSCIYLNSANFDPTDQWFKIKDAILEHPVFDWEADKVSALKGKINVMYSKEVFAGSYRCYIGQVSNAAMIVEYKG